MAEARASADWDRTAHLLALIANVNRDPKKTPAFTPSDFHPFAVRAKGPAPKVKMADVKDLLMGLGKGKGAKIPERGERIG